MTISERAGGRDNNFNLIRMLAAIGVLISHALPMSLGPGVREPGADHGRHLGTVSVYVFFPISGFFITAKFDTAGRRWRS